MSKKKGRRFNSGLLLFHLVTRHSLLLFQQRPFPLLAFAVAGCALDQIIVKRALPNRIRVADDDADVIADLLPSAFAAELLGLTILNAVDQIEQLPARKKLDGELAALWTVACPDCAHEARVS